MSEQKLFFDDVNEGDTAPAFSHELTRTDLVQYAGASGDYNPLHSDDVYTREAAGYKSVFAHGMLTMGMTGKMLTNYVGDGRLTKFGVRFTNQVWPGDTLVATATVAAIRNENGQNLVDLTLSTKTPTGVEVVSGSATARADA